MRNRRVDFQGLGRDAQLAVARHFRHGAHVVGAVGQLDQDHTHVARHRQQHLAERLRLAFLARVELQLVELGQAIHQFCHRRAKAFNQLVLGNATVFHHVVQQRGHQGLHVQLPLRALGGNGYRVRDVGFAVLAHLAQVGRIGKTVGAAQLFDFFGAEVVQAGRQRGKTGSRCVGRRRAGSRRRFTCRLGRFDRRLLDRGAHDPNIARSGMGWLTPAE